MANRPGDDLSPSDARAGPDAPRERSFGEHIVIWIGWALAAAFWGAVLTTGIEILRAVSVPTQTIRPPGAPGGMGYLALVVAAFVIVALALLYAELRTLRRGRLDSLGDAHAAALYDRIERQGGDDMTSRPPARERPERDLR
jgi:hypothetical protein